ncbi:hypothetical protein FIBSPDRAFT_18059 [Athelia psychrophila]|uniref:Uncharacterized protein n=1 Tax=Athelia psychrophila TaxID=1759441 RepID=A0A166UAL9_9AGAM|nr:hypothetical protein FIBSPDRAFT_18059 [Fibularhizoctonia sp. CBS 109695]
MNQTMNSFGALRRAHLFNISLSTYPTVLICSFFLSRSLHRHPSRSFISLLLLSHVAPSAHLLLFCSFALSFAFDRRPLTWSASGHALCFTYSIPIQ